MSLMPSNDEIKPHNGGAVNDDVAAAMPVGHEASAAPDMPDRGMPQEFTFFQKKKRTGDVNLAPALSYASAAQMTAFITRLDSAVATNSKTQRHIADLNTLMADVARTMTPDAPKPACKTLRRSKWLFYVCLVVFGIGWFLLFPSGHNLLTQLGDFLAR